MKYRSVYVTNNLKDYPEYAEDTALYPHLVEYIEDEAAGFIVAENGDFWPDREFFRSATVNIKEFYTSNKEYEEAMEVSISELEDDIENVRRSFDILRRTFITKEDPE